MKILTVSLINTFNKNEMDFYQRIIRRAQRPKSCLIFYWWVQTSGSEVQLAKSIFLQRHYSVWRGQLKSWKLCWRSDVTAEPTEHEQTHLWKDACRARPVQRHTAILDLCSCRKLLSLLSGLARALWGGGIWGLEQESKIFGPSGISASCSTSRGCYSWLNNH